MIIILNIKIIFQQRQNISVHILEVLHESNCYTSKNQKHLRIRNINKYTS